MTFTHIGNRVSHWSDTVSLGSGSYTYDAMGNQTSDTGKGLQFSYNLANLPCRVEGLVGGANAGLTLSYGYLANGTKTSAVATGGGNVDGLRYCGSFVYEMTGSGERLCSIAWDEGRISLDYSQNPANPAVRDEWHVRDHLGSTRAVVNLTDYGTVLEQNEYLPFGTRLNSTQSLATNRYRFGGKEEQRFGTGASSLDLHLSDFGARYYDPFTARWTTLDPLAWKYYSLSPYNYCAGNPVSLVDTDGKRFHKKIVGNTIYISASYSANIDSKRSAESAVSFWNNRKNDTATLDGRTYKIKYNLSVKDDRFNNGIRIADNSYSKVKDSQLSKDEAGITDKTGRVIKVKESWAETNDKGEKSSTGAHEIGHTLGMHHDITGIMSPSQDASRTEDVTQENIQQMLTSGRGIQENHSVIDKIIQFFYDISPYK